MTDEQIKSQDQDMKQFDLEREIRKKLLARYCSNVYDPDEAFVLSDALVSYADKWVQHRLKMCFIQYFTGAASQTEFCASIDNLAELIEKSQPLKRTNPFPTTRES